MTRALCVAVALASLAGCYSPDRTIPERSALDQQVEATAIQAAVDRLDLRGLDREAGTVEVVVSGLRHTDREWVRSCLEARLIRNGFDVVRTGTDPEGEQRHPSLRGLDARALRAGVAAVGSATPTPGAPRHLTLEAVVVYAGRDGEQTLIGVPLLIPGIPASFGALSLYSSATTTGRARVGLRVWEGGRLSGLLPEVQESRYHKGATFLTVLGPFRSTDIEGWEEPRKERDGSGE